MTKKKFVRSLFLSAAAALLCAFPVTGSVKAQQDTRQIINRLNQMDKQLDTLSRAVFTNEIVPKRDQESYKSKTVQMSATPADIEVRLSELEREIRSLTGRIETVGHEVSTLEAQMRRSLSDVELRLQDLEGGEAVPSGSAAPAGLDGRYGSARSSSQSAEYSSSVSTQRGADGGGISKTGQSSQIDGPGDGAVALGVLPSGPDSSAQDYQLPINLYERSFALLKEGKYDEAEKSFRNFIEKNPQHRLVSNARYWLGETYYVRGDYEQAARAFARGYKENPSGAKASDNLLKLALSLDGLGNREDACVALIQLTQKYQEGPRPVLNRAEKEIARLDCAR